MLGVTQVINVAERLQNSVQPGWIFLLPLSLVWLSYKVIYCLSPGCLTLDANWPPFPPSPAQMKRFPASCDGACHNLIRQIKKLSAVTLSSFRALASSAVMITFQHLNCCSALQSTMLMEHAAEAVQHAEDTYPRNHPHCSIKCNLHASF